MPMRAMAAREDDDGVVEQRLLIFLLAGQSNMAGRGPMPAPGGDEPPPGERARIRVWREAEGRWRQAAHPLHTDKPGAAGVGPGLAFARAVLPQLEAGAMVGLVPSAMGGSAISRWSPESGDLFAAAVRAARAALAATEPHDERSGSGAPAVRVRPVLAGILWHQGESDAVDPELARAYPCALREVVRRLPAACGAADSPLLLGELGLGFLDAAPGGAFAHAAAVNGAICAAAAEAERAGARVGVVSARGLRDRGDRLHFCAASAELLGRRYAARWLQLARQGAASRPPDGGANSAPAGSESRGCSADDELDLPLLGSAADARWR